MRNKWLLLGGLFSISLLAQAKEQQYALVATPRPLRLDVKTPDGVPIRDVWFDYDNAVLQQEYVLSLIAAATGRCNGTTKNAANEFPLRQCKNDERETFPGKDDCIIFHVVNWTSASGSGLIVSKQNWYVYTADPKWDYTSFTGARIFGKKQLYLYTIHLNVPDGVKYEERYAVDEKSKTAAFLNHLVGIGQLFGIGPPPEAEAALALASPPKVPDNWYAFRLDVKYIPSDLTITPTMVPTAGASAVASQLQGQPPATQAEAAAGSGSGDVVPGPQIQIAALTAKATTNTVTLDAKTFDNEAKYHLDFSVGVPITKITELSYVQTSNSLAPANVDKQKIFALVDFYPVAVDVKNTILPKVPYLLAGVAIGSQPLKKALVGIGWGPLYANFYAALLLNTEKVPAGWSCGDNLPAAAAGGSLSNRTCPGFNFGLNVAVGAIADALKNKASTAAK
jgi:hypothetical protein